MKFIAIDSSLANTGVAMGTIDSNGNIIMTSINLIQTEKTKNKQVRASSDTINRCRKTYTELVSMIEIFKPGVIFIETPSGSQNASGMKSYGATCQLIGTLKPIPIEVTPHEVKMASVGKKTASKKDMIEWAYNLYPNLEWDKNKDGTLKNKNEHMADAIAVVYAGKKIPEFERLRHILND